MVALIPTAPTLYGEWAQGWSCRALAVRHGQHPQQIVRCLLGPAGWLTLLGLAFSSPRAPVVRLRAEQQLAVAARRAGMPAETLRAAALAAIRDGRVSLPGSASGARLTAERAAHLWSEALVVGARTLQMKGAA